MRNKSLLIGMFLWIYIGYFYSGCAYDNAQDLYGEKECESGSISFSHDITPIIATNCAVSGCHVSGQQLPTLQNFQQISANAQKIKSMTGSGAMPPSGSGKSLTIEEINQLSCWVDSGSPDN